ncbi:PREDICTED: F-box/kelch-repeat protein At5g51250-like [Camelina sativa]|uniref:F-box/kelch-repeat protein At5g51250-like n=1 Tax=Camelina sativa TaxID=90675 RepID=A0ABM0WAH2_CAMSA|nr:PREDICTED: F-box/kelch-repeat protein At5g51250-like [Camelina sativa]
MKTRMRKKQLSSTEQSSNPSQSLPDDLVLIIVARVSVLYYPILSLVSKSFRSLLASPELYKVRSLLGQTESCLYVCLKMKPYKTPTWFTLCRKPEPTLTSSKEKRSGGHHVLATVPMNHSPDVRFSSLVAVGSDIYNIGVPQGRLKASSSSSCVSVLDCRTHTWREAPSLPVELFTVSAGVLDGKIYVVGKSPDGRKRKNSFQVLDIKTQVWDSAVIPPLIKSSHFDNTACIDGKFNVVTYAKVVAYDPKEGRWDPGFVPISRHMHSDSYCVIDNVLYCAADGGLRWYDSQSQVRQWRDLKGLVGLSRFSPDDQVRLADYGGKMAVMWGVEVPCSSGYPTIICCAVISLERLNSCKIFGKVEWVDRVFTVFGPFTFVKVIAATV